MEDLEPVIAASVAVAKIRSEREDLIRQIKELKTQVKELKSRERLANEDLGKVVAARNLATSDEDPLVHNEEDAGQDIDEEDLDEENLEGAEEEEDLDDADQSADAPPDKWQPKSTFTYRTRPPMTSVAMNVMAAHAGEEMSVSAIAAYGDVPDDRLDALRTALHRLKSKGALQRPRKGFYLLNDQE